MNCNSEHSDEHHAKVWISQELYKHLAIFVGLQEDLHDPENDSHEATKHVNSLNNFLNQLVVRRQVQRVSFDVSIESEDVLVKLLKELLDDLVEAWDDF